MIDADKKLPIRFTGKHGDRYYYKGSRWYGPNNMIGARPMTPVQPDIGDVWGLTVLGGASSARHVGAYLAPPVKVRP